MDFKVATAEVSRWNQTPLGDSIFVDSATGDFQELKLALEMPEG